MGFHPLRPEPPSAHHRDRRHDQHGHDRPFGGPYPHRHGRWNSGGVDRGGAGRQPGHDPATQYRHIAGRVRSLGSLLVLRRRTARPALFLQHTRRTTTGHPTIGTKVDIEGLGQIVDLVSEVAFDVAGVSGSDERVALTPVEPDAALAHGQPSSSTTRRRIWSIPRHDSGHGSRRLGAPLDRCS